MNPRRGILLMLAASLLWSAIEHTAFGLMGSHPPMQIVFLRYAGHLIVLLPLVLLAEGPAAFRTGRPILQLVRGLLMFGMPAFFVLGSQVGSSRWVWAVFWTMPALTGLGAVLLLRERFYAGGVLASVLGLFGAIAILGGDFGLESTVYGVAMAGTVVGYMLLSRVLSRESLAASLLYTGIGAIIPTALVFWPIWTPLGAVDVIGMLLVGVMSVLILAAFDVSLETAPAGVVVPVLALVPAWEALLGDALRHTLPTTREFAGVGAIFVGVAALLALNGGFTLRRLPAPPHAVLED